MKTRLHGQSEEAGGVGGLGVAGLFAGVGGMELGLARAGHRAVLLVENDAAAKAVLESHFPEARKHDDVRSLQRIPKGIDLLTAGFPCQDLSQSGKTRGIAGARSSLVKEVFRLLADRRVPIVVLENVPFMLHLQKGRAMSLITRELTELGYRWAYRVIDAKAFGVPQRRRRVFMVASTVLDPTCVLFGDDVAVPLERAWNKSCAAGFYWTEGNRGVGWAVDALPTLKGGSGWGIPSPPAALLPDGRVVKPDIRDAERLQGLPVDWTAPAAEVDRPNVRWRLVGNAVCANVAEWIGTRLVAPRPFDERRMGKHVDGAWPAAACDLGDGAMQVSVGEWPVRRRLPRLHEFLRFTPQMLSLRATSGFVERAERAQERGKLRFAPGFLAALREHMDGMRHPKASSRRLRDE